MRQKLGISFLWPSTYIIESTSKTLVFFSLTPSPTCKGPDKGCCSSSPKMLAVQFFSFCLILSGHRQRRLRNLTHSTNKKLFVNIPLLQGFGHLRRVTVIFSDVIFLQWPMTCVAACRPSNDADWPSIRLATPRGPKLRALDKPGIISRYEAGCYYLRSSLSFSIYYMPMQGNFFRFGAKLPIYINLWQRKVWFTYIIDL